MHRRIKIKAHLLSIVSLFACQSAMAENDETTWQLLQKTANAAHALSYKGIFIYENSQGTKAVQMTHLFNGQGEYSRNVVLENDPREVFSQGKDLVIYNPKKEKIVIEKRRGQNMFPAILPTQLENIRKNYNVREAEVEVIAGRPAKLVLLIPKDNLRYSYKFWIDQEYSLLLKYTMFNVKNEMLESIGFNQLNLLEKLDLAWFQPQINNSKSYVMEDEAPVMADSSVSNDWVIQQLPYGYIKVDQMKLMAHGKTAPVTQMIFSDGLASVSLFIEPLTKQLKPRIGRNVVGNTSFYANVQNGYQLTVVGEVPEETVTSFANAVTFKKP